MTKRVEVFALIGCSLFLSSCGGDITPTGSVSSASSSSSVSSASSSGSSSSSGASPTSTDVLTYHNDSARTGQNLTETVLTPANVNSTTFGLKGILSADGLVDAAPLVVSNLSINGTAHNVVYVATENDSVYAYDADSLALLKQVSLLGSGETAASITGGCNQVAPLMGITATPVIDRGNGPHGTLFVVAMSQDTNGNAIQRLHALDLVTLGDLTPAVSIQASTAGSGANASNGMLTFDGRQYKERSALLLSGGLIYTTWASNCDINPYNGWIIAYSEASLAQARVLNLTPNGTQGAIWNTGGLLDDGAGSLYGLLGNGTFDTQQDYGNAAVRISTAGATLTVADYFTPSNSVTESNGDVDFGSGSPMLLPTLTDASGTSRQLMFAAGKDGRIFLLDRTNLGSFNASVNQVYQLLSGALPGPMFSAPAYYNGVVYVGGVNAPLQAFALSNAQLPASATSKSATTFSYPGSFPSVSGNGTSNGIVWAVETAGPAVLHAYNPANLAQEYYNSTQAGSRDSFGSGNKFITPVIANGHVFVGTPSGVAVFGLQ